MKILRESSKQLRFINIIIKAVSNYFYQEHVLSVLD